MDLEAKNKKPEKAKSENSKPENAKSENSKPIDTKSENAKSENAKSENAKPENAKPENAKPIDAKSENAEPADVKSADVKPETNRPTGSAINQARMQIEEMKKKKAVRNAVTALTTLASALLQAYVLQAFIRPAEILSGGFTGIAILVDMITSRYGFSFPTSLGMLVINIPVAFACYKSIGARFTAFSLGQVFLTSAFLQIFHFKPMFDDPTLNVIFGGFLLGMSIVIALKGNASSGGTDFIALYVSNKTGRSIWTQVFMGNCVLYCIFGLTFGWMNAAYSILVQFISTKTISAFHHRYDRVTLQITTMKAEELMDAYVQEYRHGISCIEAVGGYSRKKMYVLHTVVSSYEAADVIRLMRDIDPHIIVNVLKTDQFYGKFYQAPLE